MVNFEQSPVLQYRARGNVRPPLHELKDIFTKLDLSSKASILVVAADVCIDLTFADCGGDEDWLGKSSERLDRVLDEWGNEGSGVYKTKYGNLAQSIALAAVRKSQIKSWRWAADSEEIKNDYKCNLKTAKSIVPLAKGHPRVKSQLMELIPVLLGSRDRHQRRTDGWLGRTALLREDRRWSFANGTNPNWDTGISLDGEPSRFVKPPIRLQIKTTATKGEAEKYFNSGIKYVPADACGFADPVKVIESCLQEVGMDRNGSKIQEHELLDTTELNAITDRIAAHF